MHIFLLLYRKPIHLCSGVRRHIHSPFGQVLEAILVAAMTAVIAFLLIYFVEDCQALGKDPIEHPLQVCVGTVETCIDKGRSRRITTTNDHA